MLTKPEDICVNRETAEALHDAGVVVESYFHWVLYPTGKWYLIGNRYFEYIKNRCSFSCSAPTAGELVNGIGHIDINLVFHYGSIKGCAWNKSKLMFVETTWHKKLCEVYADIRLKLKEAGYECGK